MKKQQAPKKKRLTRGQAIQSFCVECMGYQPQFVKDCTAPDCVLYPFRLGREVLGHKKTTKRSE